MRIVHVTNIPTPYRIAISNEINRQLSAEKHEYIMLFHRDSTKRRKWQGNPGNIQFQYYFIKSKFVQVGFEKTFFLPVGLFSQLSKLKPDVVIIAGLSIDTLITLIYGKLNSVPVVIHSGEIKPFSKMNLRHKISNLVRWLFRRVFIFPNAASWVAYGTAAKHYLQSQGIPSHKIFIGQNTVNVTPFLQIKRNNSIEEKPFHCLFSGLVNHRKGIDLLVNIARRIKEHNANIIFDIIGGDIEKLYQLTGIDKKEIPSNMIFHGFIQPGNLPDYYRNADCFIFPTRFDIFGLVLVEAAAAGLPLLASSYAGGTQDVVIEGKNGYIIDPYNTEQVIEKILFLADNRPLAAKYGQRSREIVNKKFLVPTAASGWIEAINYPNKVKKKPLQTA